MTSRIGNELTRGPQVICPVCGCDDDTCCNEEVGCRCAVKKSPTGNGEGALCVERTLTAGEQEGMRRILDATPDIAAKAPSVSFVVWADNADDTEGFDARP